MRMNSAALMFCAAGMASAFGTPHLLVESECQSFLNSCTEIIVSCTYVGMQGRQMAYPRWRLEKSKHCPYVTLMPMRWPLWQWQAVWPAAGGR